MSRPTLISPYGYSSSTCGYCSPSGSRSEKKSSKSYGFEGPQMSVTFYQSLIDRGWRRSGSYVYHPDMARTCCPQYTIRLDAREFSPSKKHRQVVNRWNRYLSTGTRGGDEAGGTNARPESSAGGRATEGSDEQAGGQGSGTRRGTSSDKGKAKARQGGFDWPKELHRYDNGGGEATGSVTFETILTPAKATQETFELYRRYQIAVHKDKPEKVSMQQFRRFLCDSPLIEEPIRYSGAKTLGLPNKYGSYHLLYKVDGKLIGISVIDVLPKCVSSVYFIWDPDWAWASLGKLSALYEISLSRRMQEAGGIEGWVYMGELAFPLSRCSLDEEHGQCTADDTGYWIANCQKMRYKSEYSPSFLLDPGTNTFHSLTSNLDKFLQSHHRGYRPFLSISTADHASASNDTTNGGDARVEGGNETDEEEDLLCFPDPPPPGFLDPRDVAWDFIDEMMVFMGGPRPRLTQFKNLEFQDPALARQDTCELVAAVGKDLVALSGKGLAGVKDRGVLFFG